MTVVTELARISPANPGGLFLSKNTADRLLEYRSVGIVGTIDTTQTTRSKDMTNTMATRKKAASLIEQALPAHQSLRYHNLGQDNILCANLPAFNKNCSPAQRFEVEQTLAKILAWDSVQDGSLESEMGNASIAIIFE